MAAVGRFLLLVTLVASPWVFGCVQPWPQFVLAAAIGALCLLRVMEAVLTRPDESVHLPLAAAAPLAVLMIAAFQLLPADRPLAAGMQHAVFAEDAGAFTASQHDSSGTLSAAATRREAARLYLALAAFLLAAQWFADPATHRGLLAALALNGAALGGFGIIQRLSGNGQLLWGIDLEGGTPFASYVNRNNAAGYLNLCLGAAIGLAILIWWQPSLTKVRLRRFSDRLRLSLSQLDGVKLSVLALVIVTTAGVLFSLSRGGIVALAIAGTAVIAATFRGSSRGGLLLMGGVILACAIGLVFYSGQFELMDERIDTLADPLDAAAGRLTHWADTAGAVRDFPLLGTGLGTYRYANPPYQQQPAHAWYYNADNHWFELLVEAGTIALIAAASGFLLIGCCAGSLLRRADPQSRAMGACGLFVILSQGTQAFTDFGLLLPANAVTFAVLVGATCGAACRAAQFERIRIPLWLSLAQVDGRFFQGLLNVAVAGAAGGFLLELYAATAADSARGQRIEVLADETPVASLDAAIGEMEQALTLRPDDGALHEALARTFVDRCRLQLYEQLLDENPSADARQRRQFWNTVSPAVLGLLARELTATGNPTDLARLRQIEPIRENLERARVHFSVALRHCPVIRNSALWLVRLDDLVPPGQPEPDHSLFSKARFVAPSTPAVLFELATLADVSGRREFAAQCWRRGLGFVPEQSGAVWKQVLNWRSPDEALARAIPDRVDVLVEIAESVEDPQLQLAIADRADQLSQQQESGVKPLIAARLDELQSRPEQAIHNYRLAISENPWDSTTRLKLAELLDRQGRLSEAVVEYSLLRRHLPNRKDIEDKFAALRLRELESQARSPDREPARTQNQTPSETRE